MNLEMNSNTSNRYKTLEFLDAELSTIYESHSMHRPRHKLVDPTVETICSFDTDRSKSSDMDLEVATTHLIPTQFARGDMIEVHVGHDEEKAVFKLHKSLLMAKVPYFATCLKDCWNSKDVVDMPEDDVGAFEVLVNWLYCTNPQQTLFLQHKNMSCLKEVASSYKLADKLMICSLKNDIVDGIRESQHYKASSFNASHIEEAVRLGLENTKLFEMVMNDAACHFMSSARVQDLEAIRHSIDYLSENPMIIRSLLNRMLDHQIRGPRYQFASKPPKCQWHDHSDGSKC